MLVSHQGIPLMFKQPNKIAMLFIDYKKVQLIDL